MIQAKFTFPDQFLWGTATAAYQVEGGNVWNDWYDWEQKGRIYQDHICGRACDWWAGQWKLDLDRAAEAGQNAHRFSIEWSRIQPDPNRWNENAIDHYRAMVRGMVDRGLTPMVTLHHFTNPRWLMEQGGWENPQAVLHFQHFVEKIVPALREYVKLWCPINEPNVYAFLGYLLGDFPPGKSDLSSLFRVMTHLARAQAAAYQVIHRLQPQARVGSVIHYRHFQPAQPGNPLDRLVSHLHRSLFNEFFPRAAQTGWLVFPHRRIRRPEIQGSQDFLGINYYTAEKVTLRLSASDNFFLHRFLDPGVKHSETGYIALTPQGLFEAVRWGAGYQLPLYITENGIDDSQDTIRPRYLAEHIHALWKALQHGWPVQGYFHWTLVDNFEWERGWSQRFGLWELNRYTQTRIKRRSADLYAAVCRENALSAEKINSFAPDSAAAILPGDPPA